MSLTYLCQQNPGEAAVGGYFTHVSLHVLGDASHWPTVTHILGPCGREVSEAPFRALQPLGTGRPSHGGLSCAQTGDHLLLAVELFPTFLPLSPSLPRTSLNAHLSPLGSIASQVLGGWLGDRPAAQCVHLLTEGTSLCHKESPGEGVPKLHASSSLTTGPSSFPLARAVLQTRSLRPRNMK